MDIPWLVTLFERILNLITGIGSSDFPVVTRVFEALMAFFGA